MHISTGRCGCGISCMCFWCVCACEMSTSANTNMVITPLHISNTTEPMKRVLHEFMQWWFIRTFSFMVPMMRLAIYPRLNLGVFCIGWSNQTAWHFFVFFLCACQFEKYLKKKTRVLTCGKRKSARELNRIYNRKNTELYLLFHHGKQSSSVRCTTQKLCTHVFNDSVFWLPFCLPIAQEYNMFTM